jgi:hypothetical protein
LAAAERRNAPADTLSQRQADLTAARRRHHEALRNLHEAERDLTTAERAYDHGKTASRDAAEMATEVNPYVRWCVELYEFKQRGRGR